MSTEFQQRVKAEFEAAFAQFEKKNADYGSAFEEVLRLLDEHGYDPVLGVLPRLTDKYMRFRALTFKPAEVVEEGRLDTLRDLATYCLMSAAYLANTSSPECPPGA